jgi:lipoteichoic acid synthase
MRCIILYVLLLFTFHLFSAALFWDNVYSEDDLYSYHAIEDSITLTQGVNDFLLVDDEIQISQPAEASKVRAASADSLIELEIKYYAPKSGAVNLAWWVHDFSLEESIPWNPDVKTTDQLLYLPMTAYGDTFSIFLKAPYNSVLEYYFWITKDNQGYIYDFWDLDASGDTIVTDGSPIIKSAVYPVEVQKIEPVLYSKGWHVFLFVSIVFILIYWAKRKYTSGSLPPIKTEKIFFIGISLALFYAIARAEIINIYLPGIFKDFRIIPQIIKASAADFYYIIFLVITFILAIKLVKIPTGKKIIYGIFIFMALFSVLVAFLNISAVINFGKPFNYPWLYYSDFLASTEAKTAIQENLQRGTAINLILICLSMLIFGYALYHAYRLLQSLRQLKRFIFAFAGLGFVVLFLMSYKADENWTKGQSENAIKTMVWSVFTAKSVPYIFTIEIPDTLELYDPNQGTKTCTVLNLPADHNVKNVVIIVLESAGAVYFDAYGGNYSLSPNLNKYESNSLVYREMYANAPSTNRSLVSILGSIYPYLSYKSITQEAPKVDHPTISSILKSEGYRTSYFSSADLNFQNCKEFLIHRGFDNIEDFSEIKCNEEFLFESIDYDEGSGIDDMCLANRLASWLDEDSIRNFFSMIWTVQGHYPYFFDGEEENFGVPNYYFNRYLNCMKHSDALIGRIMNILEVRQLDSGTLVVVVGDHGEAFGQHGQFGHASALYEENIKVPLYFINSTLFHGEHKKDIAGMKDLAPTILSLLKIPTPEIWQGRDLLNTISDEGFYFAPWSDYLIGYRKDNMKYIYNETWKTIEIYDLSLDPEEMVNLYDTLSEEEISHVIYQIATWAQYQDKFIKEIIKKKSRRFFSFRR